MKQNIGLLAGLLLLGSAAAFAAEGRTEIFEPVVLSGAGISGKYFLTREIQAAGGASAILINGTGVEEIDIDLNGFLVRGEAGGTDVIVANNVKSLVLRNGSIISRTGSGKSESRSLMVSSISHCSQKPAQGPAFA